MKQLTKLAVSLCTAFTIVACGSDGTETNSSGTNNAGTNTDPNTGILENNGNGAETETTTQIGMQEPCEGSTGVVFLQESMTLSNINTGPDYLVTCTLEFQDGTLTIEPETEIVFEQNTGLIITSNAEIRALGEYVNDVRREPSIVMRGNSTSGQPSWNGLMINSPSIDNYLENVEIHDAGSQQINATFFSRGASALLVDRQLSIKGLTIQNSGAIGLYTGQDAQFGQIDDVLFGNTESHPILTQTFIAATQIAENSESFVFSQQEQNNLQTIGIEDNLLTESGLEGRSSYVFEDLGIPYYSYSGFFGNGEIGVQISPGVEMIMASGVEIKSGGGVGGRLSFNGTQDSPITLRGAENLPGFWAGIHYVSDSALNVVSHVNSSDAVFGVLINGSLSNEIAANITDSTFANTSDCGIRINTPLRSLTFNTSGNTYTNNGQGSLGDEACYGNYQEQQ